MLAETLTITTQTEIAQGTSFEVTIFDTTMTAFCDTCSNSADGTKKELEARCWHCGSREQFCPSCNY